MTGWPTSSSSSLFLSPVSSPSPCKRSSLGFLHPLSALWTFLAINFHTSGLCRFCKGNPLRFQRPLVFRFRFRLPPAFRIRSRHLVSLPQRLRTNDVLRHPLPIAWCRVMSHDVARLIVPTRHLFRPAFRLWHVDTTHMPYLTRIY